MARWGFGVPALGLRAPRHSKLSSSDRPAWVRYAFALAITLLAAVIRASLNPIFGASVPFITLFPAVVLAGWFGGLGPGVLCTFLSAVLADYFWFEPVGHFLWSSASGSIAIATFVSTGTLLSALNGAMHRARFRAARARLAAEQSRAEAEAANRAKDAFLARVSHELRTPLNAIMGWTRMLSDEAVAQEKVPAALKTIDRNAAVLHRLVEDLLNLSRLTRDPLAVDRRPVDLVQVVRETVLLFEDTARAKRVTLATAGEADPLMVSGDALRLQQVFWNLVGNAIKFTPAGGTVAVSVRRTPGHAEVAVMDTGQGIAPEMLPHVFDPFVQTSSDGPLDGLGLGLAIARELVVALGGAIHVMSQGLGSGAHFTVSLPLDLRAPEEPHAAVASTHTPQTFA